MALVSKLISDDTIRDIVMSGQPNLLDGRTGFTTGEALEKIGMLMKNPERPVVLGSVCGQSKWFVKHSVKRIIDKLELKHFIVKTEDGRYVLYYDIYREFTTEDNKNLPKETKQ